MVIHSSHLSINTACTGHLLFPVSLLHSFPGVSCDYLSNEQLSLKSLSQGLLLGGAKLRQDTVNLINVNSAVCVDTDDELIRKWPNKAACPTPLSAFLVIISDSIELLPHLQCPGTSEIRMGRDSQSLVQGYLFASGLA